MRSHFDNEKQLWVQLNNFADSAKFYTLNKLDCFKLHKYISEKFEGGVCEELVWTNGLTFSCSYYNHEELYKNLFKLKFKGVQLAQE